MPEATSNVEFAHRITEEGHFEKPTADDRAVWAQVIEAALLAIVAVATAWSGYQAAKWGAQSDRNYSLAARTTVMSQQKATCFAGFQHVLDLDSAARLAFNCNDGVFISRLVGSREFLLLVLPVPFWQFCQL